MKVLTSLAAAGLLALSACGGGGMVTRDAPPPDMTGIDMTRDGAARPMFSAIGTPASGLQTASWGYYSRGCIAGASQMPESGPTWQAMRLSRNHHWALPQTLDLVQDLSRRAAALPGANGIYVGDMSQARGGPIPGHASHQNGLDADVWLMPATNLGLSRQERENISAVSYRRANGAYVNDRWSQFQHELVKAAAQDPRTERIFIFPGAKVAMCDAETGDRSWLRKVRPYYGHHYHFHIRLNCTSGTCEQQDPMPPADGCAEARQWQANIINPPPPDPNAPAPTPRREVQLSDLPQACRAVLQN